MIQSAMHWDMVHNMREGGEIWVDGKLFYQNGEFMVEKRTQDQVVSMSVAKAMQSSYPNLRSNKQILA